MVGHGASGVFRDGTNGRGKEVNVGLYTSNFGAPLPKTTYTETAPLRPSTLARRDHHSPPAPISVPILAVAFPGRHLDQRRSRRPAVGASGKLQEDTGTIIGWRRMSCNLH